MKRYRFNKFIHSAVAATMIKKPSSITYSELTLDIFSPLFFLFFSFSLGEMRTVVGGETKSSKSPIPPLPRLATSDLHFFALGVVLMVTVVAVLLGDVADIDCCAEAITDDTVDNTLVAMETDDTITLGSDAARVTS